MLNTIQEKLGGLVRPTWATDVEAWGRFVRLYRDYAEGRHRAKLTQEMKDMLRITGEALDQFNINYCDMVVQTMADRLTVTAITGDTEAASKWAASVLDWNRFDGLQMDIHEAAIRDGVTYAMVAYDNAAKMPVIAHEPAWDGETGMIAVYDRTCKVIVAAVKVWWEGAGRRVNLYLPDRVEKYVLDELELKPLEGAETEPPWRTRMNTAIGVPVVAFRNRAKSRQTTGLSELAAVIPMQDSLNRTLVSMIMTSELTAFQIRVAIGFPPPAKITPGMWVIVGENGVQKDQQVDAKVLEQGQIVPFINQAEFLIDQIGTVSRTPLPEFMGSENASGEALKQREIGLLGKVARFQTKIGNAWEDVMALCARVQDAFGTTSAPATSRWWTQWEDPQIRNDADVIRIAMDMRELVGDREALRIAAPVLDYDEKDIERILLERGQQQVEALARLPIPGFSQFRVTPPELPSGDMETDAPAT